MPKVYKVVHMTSDGKFMSGGIWGKDFSLQYEIGKYTKPLKGTRCFAFNTEKAARKFADRFFGSSRIFIAHSPKVEKFTAPCIIFPYSAQDLKEIWNCYKTKKQNNYYCDTVPRGTVLCSSIKLLEDITFLYGKYSNRCNPIR
jgi:hypothetical protein